MPLISEVKLRRSEPPRPACGETCSIFTSRKVGDGARRLVVFLAQIFLELFPVGGRQARITDHLPGRLVAVAAVDRVGEEAFHADLQERVEEHAARAAWKLGLAGLT